jgi:hypothetical protein
MNPTKDTTDESSQHSQMDSVEIPSPRIFKNRKLLDQQKHDVESPSLVLWNESPGKDDYIKITVNSDDGRLKGGMNRSKVKRFDLFGN